MDSEAKEVVLKDENAALPVDLIPVKYRCEVHSYDSEPVELILNNCQDVVKVTAYKLNRATNTLFPSSQKFYASADPDILHTIDKVFSDNKVPSVWVTASSESFNWNDYCNITIEGRGKDSTLLEFHQTV